MAIVGIAEFDLDEKDVEGFPTVDEIEMFALTIAEESRRSPYGLLGDPIIYLFSRTPGTPVRCVFILDDNEHTYNIKYPNEKEHKNLIAMIIDKPHIIFAAMMRDVGPKLAAAHITTRH